MTKYVDHIWYDDVKIFPLLDFLLTLYSIYLIIVSILKSNSKGPKLIRYAKLVQL
jgi:hypothetical protein